MSRLYKHHVCARRVGLIAAVVCGAALAGAGCGSIPEKMQVVEGATPANADRDVRFRTTYYFRVFDYCHGDNVRGRQQPTTDSLYRFVMTGKANAYANRVRFESGTLKASQIDPFGATVERDPGTGRHRFVSESEVQARARRAAALEEINSLLAVRAKLSALQGDGDAPSLTWINDAITNATKDISASPPGSAAGALGPPSESPACPNGTEVQRGFQIMGPQGVKTFDQEDRLILAMSSDAKPLIAALSEVSGRILKSEAAEASAAELQLNLLKEQLTVTRMNQHVAEFREPEQTEQLLCHLIASLENTTCTPREQNNVQ